MKKFGQKLKSIRSELNLTQSKVNELSNINCDTLRRIENGMVVPRYDTIIILSKIYRYDLMKLFNQYTLNEPLLKHYDLIDDCIATNDTKQIDRLYKELKNTYHDEEQQYQLVLIHEIDQMLILIESLMHLYKDEQKNIEKDELLVIEKLITKGMGIRHENYILNDYKKYKYSFIELRLLLVYALAKDHDLHAQTEYFHIY